MENTDNAFMTIDEMAEYLRIGICSAYSLAKEPGFPSVRIGKRKLIIPKDKLEARLKGKV